MSAESYTVKPGDNLWNIAKAKLGGGSQWLRIWRYNNRADVIKITGRGIPNPDLIYPGQILLLPILPGVPGSPAGSGAPRQSPPAAEQPAPAPSQPAPPANPPAKPNGGPLSQELPQVESPISIKYRLDDIKFPPIVQPAMGILRRGPILKIGSDGLGPASRCRQNRSPERQGEKRDFPQNLSTVEMNSAT